MVIRILRPRSRGIVIGDVQPIELEIFPGQEQVLGGEPVLFREVPVRIVSAEQRAILMQDGALVAQQIPSGKGRRLCHGRARCGCYRGKTLQPSLLLRCRAIFPCASVDQIRCTHRAFSLNAPTAVQDFCATSCHII